MCVGAHHCLACIPTERRIHKHPGCLPVPSVGCGHDRSARAATAKWQAFLEKATALSHNLCGAVMNAPYRQRVISISSKIKSHNFVIEHIFCNREKITLNSSVKYTCRPKASSKSRAGKKGTNFTDSGEVFGDCQVFFPFLSYNYLIIK